MLNHIDVSMITALYLYIFSLLAGLIFMAVLYFNTGKKHAGYLYYFFFFLFCLAGALLVSLRDVVGPAVSIIVANGLLILGYMMIPIGIRNTFLMKRNRPFYFGSLLIYLVLFVIFTYVIDNVGFRIYSLNLVALIILVYGLYSLQIVRKKYPTSNEIMTLAIFTIIIAIMLRVINFIFNGESGNDLLQYQLDSFFIVILGMANIFVIPGLLSIFNILQEDELKQLSRIDSLTGLANRRSLMRDLNGLLLQSKRDKIWISLYMLDIDKFKKYNDKFGHVFGDTILVDIAQKLQSVSKRPLDIVSRFGGEEFVIVLYDCDYDSALRKSEEIGQQIFTLGYYLDEEQKKPLTVSIGFVSYIYQEDFNVDELIKMADSLMYKAKSDSSRDYIGKELK